MGDWPSGFGGGTLYAADAINAGTQLTVPASANTKGAWTELEDSCPIDADGFYVQVLCGFATLDVLFDIAIGAGGSEVVILENVLVSSMSAAEYVTNHFYVPLPVKAGTRLAGRYQASSTTNDQVHVQPQFVAGDWFSSLRCGRATTYGANTADSGGTSVDPGGTINTKGAYSELSASVNGMRHALICVGNQANGARSGAGWLVDLAVGGAGSEAVVIPNMQLRQVITIDLFSPAFIERPMVVKSGQRLSARASCGINDATDRLLDLVVIGFD